jgi:hypothetical protein
MKGISPSFSQASAHQYFTENINLSALSLSEQLYTARGSQGVGAG